MTTTVATTAMPSRTRASTTRIRGLSIARGADGPGAAARALLVQRQPEIDQLLALGPEIRDRLAVDLLGDLAQIDQCRLGHRVHLHAAGGDLLEQLVVVLLALGALPERRLPGRA